jgi:hypothetical protein
MFPPRNEPDDDFTDERVAELYGSFSPHARASSLADGVCDPAVVDVAPVLQILPELQRMCAVPVPPPSSEHMKVDSLVTLVGAWAPTTPPLEPSLMTTYEEGAALDLVAMQSHESMEKVVSSNDEVNEVGALASNSDDLFVKELCELLGTLEAASPGYGKEIACVLMETTTNVIIKKVENFPRRKRKKSGVTRKASATA